MGVDFTRQLNRREAPHPGSLDIVFKPDMWIDDDLAPLEYKPPLVGQVDACPCRFCAKYYEAKDLEKE